MPFTELTKGFFEHWQALRGDALMPSLEKFLDKPSILYQPSVAIIDVISDQYLNIRLFGTRLVEAFDREPTGKNALDLYSPDTRTRLGRDCLMIAQIPCGRIARRLIKTVNGMYMEIITIALPLSHPSIPYGCLAAYNEIHVLSARPVEDTVETIRDIEDVKWIDIGSGVGLTRGGKS